MSLQQILLHLNGFPQESTYCRQTLGFQYPPTPYLCGNIREFNRIHQRFPSLQELVEFVYTPCHENCDYYIPIEFGIPILEYVMVQFGMYPRCRDIYFCHTYQLIEHRYPTLEEFINAIEQEEPNEEFAQQMNRWMAQDVDEYWNHLSPHSVHLPIRTVTEESNPSACCICQEDILVGQQVMTLPCEHTFHATSDACEGIQPWISKVGSCPLCKKELPEELRSSIPATTPPPLPQRPPFMRRNTVPTSLPPVFSFPVPYPVPVPPPLPPVPPLIPAINFGTIPLFRNIRSETLPVQREEPERNDSPDTQGTQGTQGISEIDFTQLLNDESSGDVHQIIRDVFSRLFGNQESPNENVSYDVTIEYEDANESDEKSNESDADRNTSDEDANESDTDVNVFEANESDEKSNNSQDEYDSDFESEHSE